MKLLTDGVILLRATAADGAVNAFARAVAEDDEAAYAEALAILLREGMQDSFAEYLAQKILRDGSLFA